MFSLRRDARHALEAPLTTPLEPLHRFSWSFYPLIWAQVNLIRLMAQSPAMREPIPEDIDVEHTSIPSRDKRRRINVHVYRARGAGPSSGRVVLNWHGSGFILHRHGDDRKYCSYIAAQLRDQGVTVYDLDYRKAPEHPFPACIEDAEDAILHFARLATTTHLAIGGFSAGAMCAIAAASGTKPLLQNSRVQVSSITAFYPATDGRPTAKRTMPKSKPRSGVNISPWIGRIFTTAYIVNIESVYDKRVSLILHKADELPPHLLIIAGNADSLHDDSVNFIDTLNTQSPPHPDARMLSIPEESHAWDKRPMCEESLQARDYAYKAALESIKAGLDIL